MNLPVKEEAMGGQGFDDDTIVDHILPSQNNNNDASATAGPVPIDETMLFEFPPEKTPKLSNYPIGCPVWYDTHHHPLSLSSNRFDVSHGTVTSVMMMMDAESRKFVYRVEKMSNGLSGAEDGTDLVWEDKIVFAAKCPVLVQMTDGDSMKEMEGEIVCPRATCNDGIVDTTYIVIYFLEDNKLRIEDGVLPCRIKFRNNQMVVVELEESATQVSDRTNQQTISTKRADVSSQNCEQLNTMQSKNAQLPVSKVSTSTGTAEKAAFNLNAPIPKKRNLSLLQSTDGNANELPQKIPRKKSQTLINDIDISNPDRKISGIECRGQALATRPGHGAPRRGRATNANGITAKNSGPLSSTHIAHGGNNASASTRHIFLRDLPLNLSEPTLYTFLKHYYIAHINFETDNMGKFLGSASVEMETPIDAAKAVQEKDGTLLMGSRIRVEYSPVEQGQQSPLNSRVTHRSVGEAHINHARGRKANIRAPGGCTSLFIGNLSRKADDEAIRDFFMKVSVRFKALRRNHQNDGSRKRLWVSVLFS
mmetsp:Transcript_25900/g.46707  ORF Transcript_25900/g.46707 Transcript_25900/m.46707 type:complete len:535 (-) Transcript_25900:556-2160(-)